MPVMVLGGGGVVGTGVAKYLAKNALVSKVVIADRSESRINRAVAEIGGNKVSEEILDINDADLFKLIL